MLPRSQQALIPWDENGDLPTTMEEFHRNMTLQYACRGAVLTTVHVHKNLVYPFELSGLPSGPYAGFLPKLPKDLTPQEKRDYHVYINNLAKQAFVLKDRASMELNFNRLRFLHGDLPWAPEDPFKGTTRADDMCLPYVVARLSFFLQRLTQAQMNGDQEADQELGRLTNHMNLVHDLMQGKYYPPPPVQLAVPPSEMAPCSSCNNEQQQDSGNVSLPSTSSQSTPTDNRTSSPPMPIPEIMYYRKGLYERVHSCKSPFCEFFNDPELTDWDNRPIIQGQFNKEEVVAQQKSVNIIGEEPQRQRFFGSWQGGGDNKPWMIHENGLSGTSEEWPMQEVYVSPGSYEYKKNWYNHKMQFFVDPTNWCIDVSFITTSAMDYIRKLCRQYSEWDMSRTTRTYRLYKTNHPMIFVFVLDIAKGFGQKGFFIFQGKNTDCGPYVVFKTPHGPLKQNMATPLVNQDKYEPLKMFHEYFTTFYYKVRKYYRKLLSEPLHQFVSTKETVSKVITKFRKDLDGYRKHGDPVEEGDEPSAKRVCNGVSGVASESNPSEPRPSTPSNAPTATESTSDSECMVVFEQPCSGDRPQTRYPLRRKRPQQSWKQRSEPPRKNGVCHPPLAYPLAPTPPPPRILPPCTWPYQDGHYWSEGAEIPQHGPPSPIPLVGNSPPPAAGISSMESEQQRSSTDSSIFALNEQFDAPLTPLPFSGPSTMQVTTEDRRWHGPPYQTYVPEYTQALPYGSQPCDPGPSYPAGAQNYPMPFESVPGPNYPSGAEYYPLPAESAPGPCYPSGAQYYRSPAESAPEPSYPPLQNW